LYGPMALYQLLSQSVPDLKTSVESPDPFSHPIFKNIVKKIDEDEERILLLHSRDKKNSFFGILCLIPAFCFVLNMQFWLPGGIPSMMAGFMDLINFFPWISVLLLVILEDSIQIITQKHLIVIDSSNSCSYCYSLDDITRITISSPTDITFDTSLVVSFYGKDSQHGEYPKRVPPTISTIHLKSEDEINRILQHLNITDLKPLPQTLYKRQCVVTYVVITLLLVIAFYVMVRFGFAWYILLGLTLAPSFWLALYQLIMYYMRSEISYERNQIETNEQTNENTFCDTGL